MSFENFLQWLYGNKESQHVLPEDIPFWRLSQDYHELEIEFKKYRRLLVEREIESSQRLALLREAIEDRLVQGGRCSSCKKLPIVFSIERGEYKYKDNHDSDCELAEELK